MIVDALDFIILVIVILVVAVAVAAAFMIASRIAKSNSIPSTGIDRRLIDVEIGELRRRVQALEAATFGGSRPHGLATSPVELGRRRSSPPPEEVAGTDVHWTTSETDQSRLGIHGETSVPADKRSDWDRFYEGAAAALQSAAAFNAWAGTIGGKGYRIDGSGAVASEAESPDKSDIYVIDCDNGRLVLPGFGLRRAQGLLTSDAGRAAEERLGWLFDIAPGTELRAISGAEIQMDQWRVQRKGRLSLPLL